MTKSQVDTEVMTILPHSPERQGYQCTCPCQTLRVFKIGSPVTKACLKHLPPPGMALIF